MDVGQQVIGGGFLDAQTQDEVMLPAQYLPAARLDTGSRRLMLAIMQDAFRALQRDGGAGRQAIAQEEAAEALSWFRSTDTSWMFSFERVCDELGVDAAGIRARVFSLYATGAELPHTRHVVTRRRQID